MYKSCCDFRLRRALLLAGFITRRHRDDPNARAFHAIGFFYSIFLLRAGPARLQTEAWLSEPLPSFGAHIHPALYR
jgi:hypothetical protein